MKQPVEGVDSDQLVNKLCSLSMIAIVLLIGLVLVVGVMMMRTEHFVSKALSQDAVGRFIQSRNDDDLQNGCRINYVRQIPRDVLVRGAFENHRVSMNDLNPGL